MNQGNQTRPVNNDALTKHLQKQGGTNAPQLSFEQKAREWFVGNGKKLRALTGSKEDADSLLICALNVVSKTPSLIECEWNSFVRCLLQSAELRLFPGAMNECAFVPYNNSKKGGKEATFILQYQGVVTLLYRTGMIKDIEAEIVCENDFFEYKRGSERNLIFEPAEGSLDERGERVGAYAIIRNIFGGEHISYMTAKEILSIKDKAPGSRSSDSPWNSSNPIIRSWMWKKTPLKQAAKLAPRAAKESALVTAALMRDESDIQQAPNLDIGSLIGSMSDDSHGSSSNDRQSLDAPPHGFENTREQPESAAIDVSRK